MSRRLGARAAGRRGATGLTLPAYAMRYDLDVADVVKDGSNLIGTVNDLSGGGRTLAQATGASKALWVDNGSSNALRDIMRSTPDASNGKFASHSNATACFTAASGYTAYLVFNRTAGTSGPMFIHNNNSVRGGWQLEFNVSTRQMQARTSAGVVKTATFGSYVTGTWERWIIRNWGGGSDDVDSTAFFKAAVNGVNTAVSGSPWFWMHTGTSVTVLGDNVVGAGPTFDIAEAGAFAAYMSDAQVAMLDARLRALYG